MTVAKIDVVEDMAERRSRPPYRLYPVLVVDPLCKNA